MQFDTLVVGAITLGVLILWPRTGINLPRHLAALVISSLAATVGGLQNSRHRDQ